jgi:hypothetical protein
MEVAVAGAHTFTNRQFSLPAGGLVAPCVHSLPNCVACRVVVHGAGGCGGSQRRFPTGGAAYGIPSHSLTPLVVVLVIPQTGPEVVCTVVPGVHVTVCALADFVEEPAETIAMIATVRAATANSDPNSRKHNRNNLITPSLSLRPSGTVPSTTASQPERAIRSWR